MAESLISSEVTVPRWQVRWDDFLLALEEKLGKGAVAYGEASFNFSSAKLLDEIQAECLDLAGWGYILWSKVEALRERYETNTDS